MEDRFAFHWRLFSPDIDLFQPGDFWISFDISCELPDKFENVTVELRDPDDPSDDGGVVFGEHFERSVLTQEGEFVQYTGFRNSTYLFMNDTCPRVSYPAVEDAMEFRLHIGGPSVDFYAFNLMIQTETLRPSIEILSPPVMNSPAGSLVRLSNDTSTLRVNFSDPTGIQHARLLGLYTNKSTGERESLLLVERTGISSGVALEMVISVDAVLQYAELSNQTGEDTVTINALLEASDLVGMSTQRLFRVEYSLRAPYGPEGGVLETLQYLFPAILTGLASVLILYILIVYVRVERGE